MRSSVRGSATAGHPSGDAAPHRAPDRAAVRPWKTGPRGRPRRSVAERTAPSRTIHDQRLALTLHIGTGKTGPPRCRPSCGRTGPGSPRPGGSTPDPSARAAMCSSGSGSGPTTSSPRVPRRSSRHRQVRHAEELRREVPRRLLAEVGRAGLHRVLMSDEALSAPPSRRWSGCGSSPTRTPRSVRLVCYLRRQDDHLVSRYQQAVKRGEPGPSRGGLPSWTSPRPTTITRGCGRGCASSSPTSWSSGASSATGCSTSRSSTTSWTPPGSASRPTSCRPQTQREPRCGVGRVPAAAQPLARGARRQDALPDNRALFEGTQAGRHRPDPHAPRE